MTMPLDEATIAPSIANELFFKSANIKSSFSAYMMFHSIIVLFKHIGIPLQQNYTAQGKGKENCGDSNT
jgi:hypothetical protein